MRAEDVSFETLLEGNDSIFTNNLQDHLALGNVEKRVPENTARRKQLFSNTKFLDSIFPLISKLFKNFLKNIIIDIKNELKYRH